MSFQPVLPATGLVGYRFLERTAESHQAAFRAAPTNWQSRKHWQL